MTEIYNNERLAPVFSDIIPKLVSNHIEYWVYGGVAVAGVLGRFVRENSDVDIFVLDDKFEHLMSLMLSLAKDGIWECCYSRLKNGRPKVELKIRKRELFSAVPVTVLDNKVRFLFDKSTRDFDTGVLTPVSRSVGNYNFLSPENKYVKELFIHFLQKKGISKEKRLVDAKYLLAEEEQITYIGYKLS